MFLIRKRENMNKIFKNLVLLLILNMFLLGWFNSSWKYRIPITNFAAKNDAGIKQVFEYIKRKDIKNIVYLSGKPNSLHSIERLNAVKKYSKIYNIKIQKILNIINDIKLAYNKSKTILETLPINFQAVLSSSDHLAAGFMKALIYKNINIPKDIKVIGFDNTEYCDILNPALTSVDQNMKEVSKHIINWLRNTDSNLNNKLTNIKIQPILINRDSA